MTRKDSILLIFWDMKPWRDFVQKTVWWVLSVGILELKCLMNSHMTISNKFLKILTLILEMSELLFEGIVQNEITKNAEWEETGWKLRKAYNEGKDRHVKCI